MANKISKIQLNGTTYDIVDEKVTSAANHYSPSADSGSTLSADASSSTPATWGSTDLVTGVNIQRDTKGHVTGVTVDSIQMPANPNTTYTHPTSGITAGSYTKVTVNAQGHVTSGSNPATTIATSTGTNELTLEHGKKYALTAAGDSFVFTMPSAGAGADGNTTYTFATGDSNGQIKVTPSDGSAQNVSVKGLGSAAYTASTAYLASSTKYAGSSSVGGAATSATKLATARYIDGHKFDGSENVSTIYPATVSGGQIVITTNGKFNRAAGSILRFQFASQPTGITANYQVFVVDGQTWGYSVYTMAPGTDAPVLVPSAKLDSFFNAHCVYEATEMQGYGNNILIMNQHNFATDSAAGLIKVSSVNTSAVTVNNESTTAGRYYPIELNSDGKAIVNVPWTSGSSDTNYYHTPTSSSGIKIGTGTGVADMYVPTGTTNATVAVGNHTHKYAGSSSAGGAATSANKVNNSLTIQLNGGSTEGTNKFTFNGSTAKSMNITPAGIGAATSEHTHATPSNFSIGTSNSYGTDQAYADCGESPYGTLAVGTSNTVYGKGSVALGIGNISYTGQLVCGQYNEPMQETKNYNHSYMSGTYKPFVVGAGWNSNGSIQKRSVMYVGDSGAIFGKYLSTTGFDYAEWFEWEDGNPNNEDRRGKFVTLIGEKVRIASDDDSYILGVVSSTAGIIGDSAESEWVGKFTTDIFGATETETIITSDSVDASGKFIPGELRELPKLNPEFDPSLTYIPRSERPEWVTIGLLGKVVIDDDGTCEVGKKCKPNAEGIATLSNDNTGYYVMSRIDENHIKVFVK